MLTIGFPKEFHKIGGLFFSRGYSRENELTADRSFLPRRSCLKNIINQHHLNSQHLRISTTIDPDQSHFNTALPPLNITTAATMAAMYDPRHLSSEPGFSFAQAAPCSHSAPRQHAFYPYESSSTLTPSSTNLYPSDTPTTAAQHSASAAPTSPSSLAIRDRHLATTLTPATNRSFSRSAVMVPNTRAQRLCSPSLVSRQTVMR